MNSNELIKMLKKQGWIHVRTVGSHHQFKHPNKPELITIPHPKKDLKKGLVAKIRKQAGL